MRRVFWLRRLQFRRGRSRGSTWRGRRGGSPRASPGARGSAPRWGGGGGWAGAVQVEEIHVPGGVRCFGVWLQGDVLVAEVAVEEAGIVHGACLVGHALEEGHQGRAIGGFGVDAVEFVAQIGELRDEGGDEMGLAEARAFPVFGYADGRGGADAGVAQEEGVAKGPLGLAADELGAAVAPGGLDAVGFDDDFRGGIAAGQLQAVDLVASGGGEEGRLGALQQEAQLRQGFGDFGAVPARRDLQAPGAQLLPDGFIGHGVGGVAACLGCWC